MFDIVENPYIIVNDSFVCAHCPAQYCTKQQILVHLATCHGIRKATEDQLREANQWHPSTRK